MSLHPKAKRLYTYETMDKESLANSGRKGGLSVSKNKKHMAKIGSRGGKTVGKDSAHMAKIGRMGGLARARKIHEAT